MKLVQQRFWYPVLDSVFFQHGDVIWIEATTIPGYHEVLGSMKSAILVRPMTEKEIRRRRRRGRWRRFWIRLKRRLFGKI